MESLKNKVIIITGAGSGIGEGTAYYFLKYDCKLALVDRNSMNLEKVISACRSNRGQTQVISIVADITKNADRKVIIGKTIQAFGRIDVLVNNAGITQLATATETTEKEYDHLFEINTRSHVFLTQLAVPHLKASKGCIVNVSSFSSQRPLSAFGVYSMTKAATDVYTGVLAVELGKLGVRVNAVNPGAIRTQITRKIMNEKVYESMLKDGVIYQSLGRVGEPEDVAKCIAFLASDMASFVTGQHLFVDGGRHCKTVAPKL